MTPFVVRIAAERAARGGNGSGEKIAGRDRVRLSDEGTPGSLPRKGDAEKTDGLSRRRRESNPAPAFAGAQLMGAALPCLVGWSEELPSSLPREWIRGGNRSGWWEPRILADKGSPLLYHLRFGENPEVGFEPTIVFPRCNPVLTASKRECGENGRRLENHGSLRGIRRESNPRPGARRHLLYPTELRRNSSLTSAKCLVNPQGCAPCSPG